MKTKFKRPKLTTEFNNKLKQPLNSDTPCISLLIEKESKKSRSLLCEGKRVRFQFITEYKKTFPIRVARKTMGVSPSAFYLPVIK